MLTEGVLTLVNEAIIVFPALLRQKVEEVGKQTEQRRREQERSFRLVSQVFSVCFVMTVASLLAGI